MLVGRIDLFWWYLVIYGDAGFSLGEMVERKFFMVLRQVLEWCDLLSCRVMTRGTVLGVGRQSVTSEAFRGHFGAATHIKIIIFTLLTKCFF